MTDEQISSFRPAPGDVIVLKVKGVISQGEAHILNEDLKQSFPDNRGLVLTQSSDLDTRFAPFDLKELGELKDCLEHARQAKGALPEADAGALEAEVDAELERKRTAK